MEGATGDMAKMGVAWGPPWRAPGPLYNPPQLQRLRILTNGFIMPVSRVWLGFFSVQFLPLSPNSLPIRLGWGWGAVLLYLARFRARLGRNVTNA